MHKLTEIEKRCAAAMLARPGVPPGFDDINNPQNWPIFRERMRLLAYHEAGHFVARLFTQLEVAHVLAISIIGNDHWAGYVRSERGFTEQMIESYPPPLQRSNGMMLLLQHLAGLGAEVILDQSEEGWESCFDYWNWEDGDEEEGTDVARARRIAEIMAKPYMPVNRILNIADKWALEMLRMPAIWNVVETVAGKLIEQGEITDEIEELLNLAYDDANFPSVYHLPKWKRRILPKPGELEKFIERE